MMSIDPKYYLHPSDKAALRALKAIPGFSQLMKAFMKIWSERQFRILNMSSKIRISETQFAKYYDMLQPICEKLGIDIPELYLELDVSPNAYTAGDTKPFIVVTSGLLETIPDDLVPTVLAHECGHIACHHVLYSTIGNLLLNGAKTALQRFIPFGSFVSYPLVLAFYYWMRCSELSADRAAVIYDGNAAKMSEVCMRFAGWDKDIVGAANKEEFLKQAQEYRKMVSDSKWDKTLEFLLFSEYTHPMSAIRALECEEFAASDQFQHILDGTYLLEADDETKEADDPDLPEETDLDTPEKKQRKFLEFGKFMKRSKEDSTQSEDEKYPEKAETDLSIPDQIRQYKGLFDDGIITEEEFLQKKKQLLNL